MYKCFFAFITNYVIGIYTDYDAAIKRIGDRKCSIAQFSDYDEAFLYIKLSLSIEDQRAFGISIKKMAYNKPYYRQRKNLSSGSFL